MRGVQAYRCAGPQDFLLPRHNNYTCSILSLLGSMKRKCAKKTPLQPLRVS